jgi:hypothetical protein
LQMHVGEFSGILFYEKQHVDEPGFFPIICHAYNT